MTQVLYRKYRPQKLSDLVGQAHITQTLKNVFQERSFAHAYFFTGPKGTGKTSTARIIAKAANCVGKEKIKPCGKCDSCIEITEGRSLDLIEIDAASNRGIEESRDLREKINFLPVKGAYKIYIIDEVHMLTSEAFNALLKTLEEPPAHVIFILCTTEPHKVPQTIISRCQRFDFKRASVKDLIIRLKQIAESEKVIIDEEALRLIAQNASGGFRDAETLLDQVISYVKGEKETNITASTIHNILGIIDGNVLNQLVQFILERNTKDAIIHLNKIIDSGFNILQLNRSLIEHMRSLLLILNKADDDLLEITSEQYEIMSKQTELTENKYLVALIEGFLEAENSIKNAQIPQLPLEIAIIELTQGWSRKWNENQDNGNKQEIASGKEKNPFLHNTVHIDDKNKKAVTQKAEKEEHFEEQEEIQKDSKITKEEIGTLEANQLSESNGKAVISVSEVMEKWPQILKTLKPHNHSVEAFLKASRPISVEGRYLMLEVFYSFHKEQIEYKKNRDLIELIITEVLGVTLNLKCTLTKKEDRAEEVFKAAQKIFNDTIN